MTGNTQATGHLGKFPKIAATVQALADEGLLTHRATEPWFGVLSAYATPEGHAWGAEAHRIVAETLASRPATSGTASDQRQRRHPEPGQSLDRRAPFGSSR